MDLCSKKVSESHSVMSDSLRPHGHNPWNSPGQNTGVEIGFWNFKHYYTWQLGSRASPQPPFKTQDISEASTEN